jgi:hypothetical protein
LTNKIIWRFVSKLAVYTAWSLSALGTVTAIVYLSYFLTGNGVLIPVITVVVTTLGLILAVLWTRSKNEVLAEEKSRLSKEVRR